MNRRQFLLRVGLVLSVMLPSVASAGLITVTGAGGAIPDDNPAGATFDILIPVGYGDDIPAQGNNVTLTLINFHHPAAFDLRFTLEHVGFGSSQFILDRVLDSDGYVSSNNFIGGEYTFTSDATTTIQDIADIGRFIDIPSACYVPTMPNDSTDSEMSSFWNGQSPLGTWRLFGRDTDGPPSGSGGSNADWTWRLDIETVPEPATATLMVFGLAALVKRRRRRAA